MSSTSLPGLAVLADVREVLGSTVGAVRAGALAGAQAPELAEALRSVLAAQAQLHWLLLAVTREVDASGCHVTDGALTAAAWLRQQGRLPMGEASAAVQTARALGSGCAQDTFAALAAGEIPPAAAQHIAKAARDAPPGAVALIEPHALDVARSAVPAEVARVMQRFREALDADGSDEAAVRRYERRGVSVATTIDGMVAGRFLLDPAAGSPLLSALDAAQPRSTGDRRSAAQRRADALSTIARHFLDTADLPRTAGARPHVIVTGSPRAIGMAPPGGTEAIGTAAGSGEPDPPSWPSGLSAANRDALAAAVEAALTGDDARLSWVGPVAPGTAARVACDAHVTVVGVDPDGTVRDIRKERRLFTWAQRTAIIARDGDRCPWPYCDRPIRWSDGHHLRPYSHGGPTTVANGALPCEGHHLLLHEAHWTLLRLTDGRYLARHDRTGRQIGPEPHRRPRGVRPPPIRRE